MREQTKWAWIFILPCLLGLTVFTYLPTVGSFGLSFAYWNLLGTPHWVGLNNYQEVLSDPLFWQSFWVTWIFVIASALLQVVLGMLLAVLIHRLICGKTFFRTAYFVPFITPMISVALVWSWLYDTNTGVFNWLLQSAHLINTPIAWLQDPNTALFSVILLQTWKMIGYNLVIFIAGLQGIPEQLYESAELDGAGPWKTFWKITLPMMSPILFFVVVMSVINSFQAFDAVYLLTQGGPQHTTEILVYWMFKNAFEFYKAGPASAIAYILFVVILILTIVQWQLRKRWVLYEDEV